MSAVAVADVPRGNEAHLAPRVVELDTDLIDVGENVRSSVGDLTELAASIAAEGVQTPIKVRRNGSRYTVVYGQRRLGASKLAGKTTIPAILDERDPDVVRDTIEQLSENLQRDDLPILDAARGLAVILKAEPALTQTRLAERLGMSAPWVSNTLRILELAKPVQKLVADGKLTASHAKVLAGVAKDQQQHVADLAIQRGSSSHDLERDVEWMTKNAARQKDDAKRNEDARKKFLATLEAKVPKEAPVVVGGHGDIKGIVDALKAAGVTHVRASSSWVLPAPGPKFCDCVAWFVSTDYAAGELRRMCVKEAHRKAANDASTAKQVVKDAARQASVEAVKTAIAAEIAEHPIPRFTAQVLFVKGLGSWQGEQWAEGRTGAGEKKKPDVWGAASALTDDELAAALADVLIKGLEYSGIAVDRIAKELAPAEASA